MAMIDAEKLDALAESCIPASDSEGRACAVACVRLLCEKILQYIIDNADITLQTSLNTVFTAGVPVPQDGGAALQTAWKAATDGGAADSSGIL